MEVTLRNGMTIKNTFAEHGSIVYEVYQNDQGTWGVRESQVAGVTVGSILGTYFGKVIVKTTYKLRLEGNTYYTNTQFCFNRGHDAEKVTNTANKLGLSFFDLLEYCDAIKTVEFMSDQSNKLVELQRREYELPERE